uniref:Alpha-1,4-N-acetylglucosaminyltransferase n=1 Tax=Suricata suricatta TaxID=37032 RepID=A0A673V6T0_SURSU
MPRPPDCLLRLLRGAPSQRACTLLIISFKFTFFVSVMIYWHIAGEPSGQREFPNLPADVPCPRWVPPKLISSAPPPGNIFFLETSDRTNPNFLFMCSVESAARAHPEARVVVLMKGLSGGNTSLPRHLGLSLLGCFPNVHLLPLDLEALFRDTPLEAWYATRRRRWEPYLLPVLSDASRIALLWKFGGIYLDTDFIVLRNLQNLTNTLRSCKPGFRSLPWPGLASGFEGGPGAQGPKDLTDAPCPWTRDPELLPQLRMDFWERVQASPPCTATESYMDVPPWEPEPRPSSSPERALAPLCHPRSLGTGQEASPSPRCLDVGGRRKGSEGRKASWRGRQPYGEEHEDSVAEDGREGQHRPRVARREGGVSGICSAAREAGHAPGCRARQDRGLG